MGALLPSFKQLATDFDTEREESQTIMLKMRDLIDYRASEKTLSPYEQLVELTLLPKLRLLLVRTLNDRESIEMKMTANVFHRWSSILPTYLRDRLVMDVILPALQHRVEEVSRQSSAFLQIGLLPWTNALAADFFTDSLNAHFRDTLYSAIRRKLHNLVQADPLEEASLELLFYWRPPALSDGQFDLLISRTVLPALDATLNSQLVIDPTHQDYTPIRIAFRLTIIPMMSWLHCWRNVYSPLCRIVSNDGCVIHRLIMKLSLNGI